MPKNVALVGFMGAGKSVVAMYLASTLKRELISTDALIVEREKRPITDIFRDSGEAYFRELEKKVVAEVNKQENLIIDCGGGIVLNRENIDALKKSGILIYLSATPKIIYERIRNQKHRPLLNVPNPQAEITELLESRKPLYNQADYKIDTSSKTVEEVAREIIKILPHD